MNGRKILAAAVVIAALTGGIGYARWTQRPLTLAELTAIYKLPNSQFTEIDGLKVHFAENGAKDLPCLVLAQGATMNLRLWDDLVSRLQPQFHILRIDTLTQGLTAPDPQGDYSAGHDTRILETFMQRLGLTRCTFIGNGGGGRIAYRYAAAHPAQVDKLVLIASEGAPHPVPAPKRQVAKFRRLVGLFSAKNAWTDRFYESFGAIPPTRELLQMTYDMNRRAGLEDEQRLADAAHAGGDDAEAVLPKITAPTLLLWGTGDTTTPSMDAESFAAWLTSAPSTTRLYNFAGHYPFIEFPKDVTRDILEFLSGAHQGDEQKQ